MSEGFGPAGWLPAGVLARQEAEARAEDRAARAEQQAREAAAEAAHDRAVAAYLQEAASRGETVSARDVMAGRIGYTVAESIARHQELADRIPKHQRGERDYELLDAEPVIRSSRGPETLYEVGRMVGEAEDNRRWMVGYLARHDYPAAEAAVRAKAGRWDIGRSAPHAAGSRVAAPRDYGEITRVVTDHGNVAWLP